MSITITGGISFSGGVGIVAPPSVATAGWYGGGELGPSKISTVNRMTFATDTATASVRGSLSIARYGIAGAGTLSAGWFSGGYAPSVNPGFLSRIDRITYANDTVTATVRGPLATARIYLAATGNTTDGWYAGGQSAGDIPGSQGMLSTVDRITYATDTATASSRGLLATSRTRYAATGNDNYGWFSGGSSLPGPIISSIDRIDYANDTATASARGPLSSARNQIGSTSNSTYGWFGGGYLYPSPSPYEKSTVDRITFATDTATASVRGPLNIVRQGPQGVGNNDYGWFATSNSYTTAVSKITYATDTATATASGPLSVGARMVASTSGIQ